MMRSSPKLARPMGLLQGITGRSWARRWLSRSTKLLRRKWLDVWRSLVQAANAQLGALVAMRFDFRSSEYRPVYTINGVHGD
jgi:hypothetical protein